MSDKKPNSGDLKPGEKQTAATTEANKPNKARAKDAPKAGNILGGVQPEND